jgi:hypothetical protein
MAQKLTASIPLTLDLDSSWTIQWAALDPASGAAVSGVNVSNVGMIVSQVSPGTADQLQVGPFQLIPLDELNS